MEVTGLDLLQWRSLAWDFSLRYPWLRPAFVEIDGLDLVLGDHWFNPGPTEVAGSGLLPKRWLPHTCTSEVCCKWSHWLRPAFTDVPGLGLLQRRSLAWAWSCGVHWLGSAPMKLDCSGRWSYLFKLGCSPIPRDLPDPALPHLVLGLIACVILSGSFFLVSHNPQTLKFLLAHYKTRHSFMGLRMMTKFHYDIWHGLLNENF